MGRSRVRYPGRVRSLLRVGGELEEDNKMITAEAINNFEDVIDSRDIVIRIEHLQEEDTLTEEEASELWALRQLALQGADYAADWHHGVTLIRDSYFRHYAEELADECGMITDAGTWPNYCIDWEFAARELQMDYSSIDFDGVDYWVR